MSQIMYNYSAMLTHAGNMSAYAATLQGLGTDISAERAALQAGWQGETGMTYQAWQVQWSQALENMVHAYQSMASTHQNNILTMLARDQNEAAKWGG
ncbi:WXG100 family type VII secretion target EsxH [Mycobacterium uberis]|uniref:ESAT-6-like protein n=1 Tax=Mycobacterium uberis TaxID=2162698 RepID=A0A3E1HE10_9MYCO|nr:WXG100 family type VII secretion target [Mycobacterium uberis]RFD24718.1 WXG100 family type VII secretion target EsxH [Mycobacterium uberis]